MSLISADFFPQCLPNCTQFKPTSNFNPNSIVNCKNPNLNYSSSRTAHIVNLSTKLNPTHLDSQRFTNNHCVSILQKLKESDKFDECLDYLRSIVDKGYKPDMGFCTELIRRFSCCEDFDKAVEVVEILELSGEPDVMVYNDLIYGFCKSQIVGSAVEVLSRMRNRGIMPDVDSYNHIIASLCSLKTLDLAMKMLDEMRDANCVPAGFTYLILIGANIVKGEMDEAVELIEKVLLREGLQPNLRTYNKIIVAMCNDGQMDRAFDFIKSLNSKGYEPHLLPFNCLLYTLLNGRRWKEAETLVKEMLSTNYEPNNHTYIIIMRFLLRDGRIEEAMDLMKLMIENGIKPDGTLVHAICMFYKESMLDFALMSVDYIIACDSLPKINNYHSFLGVLCKNGGIDEAIRIVKKLEEVGRSPDVGTYNILISHTWNRGDRIKALGMAVEMLDKGIEPDNNIYVTLISCLCKDGLVDEALVLLRDMEMPNLSYKSVILGLCRTRRIDDAIRVLDEMVEKGCKPDENVYATLIEGIVLVGRRAEAKELTKDLYRMGVLSGKKRTRLNRILASNGCYQRLAT